MPALLETRQLSLKKDERKPNPYLLEDINFSVPFGSIYGIFGPSGSGKSTLLKCLCRLEEATSGTIFFHEKPIREYDPRVLRRRMTLVFQIPILSGPTVWDDLRTGFRWKNGQPAPRNITRSQDQGWGLNLLSQVHLPDNLLGENPKNLSVGEAQRVALARALAIHPEVLLLDEPTAALDPDSKIKIETTIRELSQKGITILLVSHEERQIQALAQSGLELRQGKVHSIW